MINCKGLGHINIVVDDLTAAIKFYSEVFKAIPHQTLPNFKNKGYAKSLGHIDNPDKLDVSISFLEIPKSNLFLELSQYHQPQGQNNKYNIEINDQGGARYIALQVDNITECFNSLSQRDDITMLTSNADYKPYQLDKVGVDEFYFHNQSLEENNAEKEKLAAEISALQCFFFKDKYNVMWEIEQ